MSSVPSGLAALVTQAPADEDTGANKNHEAKANHVAEVPESKAEEACSPRGLFCRCIYSRKETAGSQNLAAVVPDSQEGGRAKDKVAVPATTNGSRSDSDDSVPAATGGGPDSPAVPAPQEANPAATATVAAAACRQGQPAQVAYPKDNPTVAKQTKPQSNVSPYSDCQLSEQFGQNIGRKTLVLDLDETLVHSSFRAVKNPDIVINVELEGENHGVYVLKRPGVDEFLVRVAQLYEIVVYTASMAKYANPLLDELDKHNVVTYRLFREACTRHTSGYMKDLSRLGRNLQHVIIIDNSPTCYALQPDNAIPIKTWRDDMSDRELMDLVPILHSLADVDDIPVILKQIVWAGDDVG